MSNNAIVRRAGLGAALALTASSVFVVHGARGDAEAKVDAVFARYSATTPGCAVGVAVNGKPVLMKGYGMADLEHDVPITPDTIFEAGSVSKQFTAAAILQLAGQGRLSLDAPVREYIPELPDYGKPLLVRHMLNHTSGLRDWGSVAAVAGWPRTTRAYTQAHVLEIAARQKSLNFEPGTRWSYSNTGFNLAAMIVARASSRRWSSWSDSPVSTAFSDYSRAHVFLPNGMTHTSWRDDYTRVVKNRAVAYSDRGGEYKTDMPFENVYGNGGLLTTVGDLLKWNQRFDAPSRVVKRIVELQQTGQKFNDGRGDGYALGLFLGEYRGVREVDHSGSTAGYSAYLTRFPDQHLSVAVLCNVTANATQFAHQVSEAYLTGMKPPAAVVHTLTDLTSGAAGMYRSKLTGVAVTLARNKDDPAHRSWTFDARGGAIAKDDFGTTEDYERVQPDRPSAQDLAEYASAYFSDEAEVEIRAVVEGGKLLLKRRPDSTAELSPTYKDGFTAPGYGTIVFRRNASGNIEGLSVSQDRVWDLRFKRR